MTDAENGAEFLEFQHFRVPIIDGRPLELGRGAMGITYKAYDQSLHIDVALKVINSAILSSDNVRERFMREARAAASLRHPCVAAVYYLGEQGDDVFYSMEFVEGETVEARIRREGAMPVLLALKVVADVAAALAAAERQTLVHRDIKPSNIMLVASEDGEPGVKVIDFGLAKNLTSSAEADATLTQGGFLGTPHFASPEQLEESHVDTRSDIYSLGVTLFYMLAGHTPFGGSTAQVMSQQLSREPPIEELVGLSPAVLALLKRMLAKKRAERPATAVDLRRQVLECIEAVKSHATAAPAAAPDEAMATMVTPPLVLESGQIVLDRFALGTRISASGAIVRFQATDQSRDGLPVEAIFFNSDTAERAKLCAAFEKRAADLDGVTATAIPRIVLRTTIGARLFTCVERAGGTSLLRIMKARRSLPLPEALLVLRPLAEASDEFAAKKIRHLGFSLYDILLTPAREPATPLQSWQPLEIKFDALRVESFDSAPAEGTLVKPSGALPREESQASPVTGLACLAYEILGGSRFDSFHDHWTPLAELSQGANLVVKRGLESPESFASATQFIEALGGSTAALTPAAPIFRQPPPRAAPPPLPVPAMLVSPPPAPPAKKRGPLPFIIGAAALLGCVAAAIIAFRFFPQKPEPAPPAIDTTPRVVREPNAPSPTPRPGSDSTRETYQAQYDRARKLETDADYDSALIAYAKLADDHPNDQEIFASMERIAAGIRTQYPAGIPDSEFQALRPSLETAATHGTLSAQFVLGKKLMQSEPTEGLRWMIKAAEAGQTQAMVLAGLMLSNGKGVPRPELENAAQWFQKAADRNDIDGIFSLADCYLNGKGVKRDAKRAAGLLTVASNLGDDRAMDWLADMYRKGNGVPASDPKKAFELYTEAVKLGNLNAQGGLGVMYMNGEHVPPDPAKAVSLWKEGAGKGNPTCMFFYAYSLEDPAGGNNKEAAKEWYVQAAKKGDIRAMEWCARNGVSLTGAANPQSP